MTRRPSAADRVIKKDYGQLTLQLYDSGVHIRTWSP